MEGGTVDDNQAVGGNGGGIYVSSTSANPVTVNVLSGSVSSNQAGISGGALAVKGEEGNPITVTVGVNMEHNETLPHGTHGAVTCPVINSNVSNVSGGAVYVSGSQEAKLYVYCMTEEGNDAGDESRPSDFMMVEGGTVEITTEEPGTQNEENIDEQDGKHGKTVIRNTIYVVGGAVNLWGTMRSPDISNTITVDIRKEGDGFFDNRIVDKEGTKYYKLRYFENFTDPVTRDTTGLYKQIRVEQNKDVTIDGFIYQHTGYEIGGWNTDSNNEHKDFATKNPDDLEEGAPFYNDGWYNCNQDYLFDGDNREHLTLYAIWYPIGYVIIFDPNVGENEDYTGDMPEMGLKYDEEQPLTKNAFGRPGYTFKEWNTEADGTGKSYADEARVKNLSTRVGEPVTLYAQWTPCDHDPGKHTYTYTVNENVLTAECECKGCTVTATLNASDIVYDQNIHKADLEITISDTVTEAVEAKLRNYTVVYEQYTPPAEGETEGTWAPMDDGKYPVNAGKYRASIATPESEPKKAVKEYAILKADQPAPPKPTYKTHEDDATIPENKLIVDEVAESNLKQKDTDSTETGKIGYNAHVEYAVVYEQGDGTQSEPKWQTGREFTLDQALTNYHVLVRYSDDTNYHPSEPSRSDSKYFFPGKVKITVHGVDGVDDKLEIAAQDSDEVVTGVKLTLTIQDGYYLPKGYDIKKIDVDPVANGKDLKAVHVSAEETATKQVFSITGIKSDSVIDIYLNPVKKLPTIQSFVTEGEVFADFEDNQAIISRDSSYTAKFVVENFDKEVYTGKFAFENLPAGTPLILMKKISGTTIYYRANATGNVALTDFVEMGKKDTRFSWNENEQNVTLQLVAVNSGALPGNATTTTFVLEHDEEAQPNAADVSGAVTTELRDE